VLYTGLVSQVGASHGVNLNLIAPLPLGLNCPRKIICYVYVYVYANSYLTFVLSQLKSAKLLYFIVFLIGLIKRGRVALHVHH